MAVTVAILLGASKFPGYPSFGANRRFRQSKEDFLSYLQRADGGLGVSEENVLDLFNSSSQPHAQIEEIRGFLEQARSDNDSENNLIVYYVGHGMVPGGELLLAVQSVRVRMERYTGLSVRQLAETFKDSARTFRRFVFLDCCFAAKAVESMQASPQAISNMMAAPFMDEEIDDGPDVGLRSGTALYCATDKDSPALSPDNLQRTMFTDALISALETGHSKLAPRLTMADVNRLVRSTLKSRHGQDAVWPELHAPDQHDGDITQHVRLFPNSGGAPCEPQPTPVGRPDLAEVRELTQALAQAERRASVAAAEIERRKDAEAALIQNFARERENAESIVGQRVSAARADLEAKLGELQGKLAGAEAERESEKTRLTNEVQMSLQATSAAQQGQIGAEAKLRLATAEIENLHGRMDTLVAELITLRSRVAQETQPHSAAPLLSLAAPWTLWIGERRRLFAGFVLVAVLICLVWLTQQGREEPVPPFAASPTVASPETASSAHLPAGYIPPGRDCPYGEIKAKGKCIWNRCIGNPERGACEADILSTGR